MKNHHQFENQKILHKVEKSFGGMSNGNGMNEALDDLHTTLQMVRNRIDEEKMKELIHYQWSTIIDHIDFIFLVICQVINILGSVLVVVV